MTCFLGAHDFFKKNLVVLAEIVQAGLVESSAVVDAIVALEMAG